MTLAQGTHIFGISVTRYSGFLGPIKTFISILSGIFGGVNWRSVTISAVSIPFLYSMKLLQIKHKEKLKGFPIPSELFLVALTTLSKLYFYTLVHDKKTKLKIRKIFGLGLINVALSNYLNLVCYFISDNTPDLIIVGEVPGGLPSPSTPPVSARFYLFIYDYEWLFSTPGLSGFEILNDTTFIFPNWLVLRLFIIIFYNKF